VTATGRTDWNPETYARFRGLRLRPALDLLAQVRDLPEGPVIDLGCGNGAVGPALATRFPDHRRIGVDASPAMLAKAKETGCYHVTCEADIGDWKPPDPAALIFANAALHWLPDHSILMPRLVALLAPGGTLAVQMPRQYGQPSHRFLRDIAAAMFPDRFDLADWQPPVSPAADYWAMLEPLGEVSAWETDYIQPLPPGDGAHPVRRFTESTAMRPYLDRMDAAEAQGYTRAYDEALASAYPLRRDGSALMPFRRTFFTLRR
jgi:trans-aconitate 2-methyltransferase